MRRQPALFRLVRRRQGLRISRTVDVFEALAWAIIGQQINLAFAYRLRRTLIELAGAPTPGRMRAHPTPEEVAGLDVSDLRRRQFSTRKAEYLIGAAQALAGSGPGMEDLKSGLAGQVHESLVALRGVGTWTASYVMLRSLQFSDCVPVGDAGLNQALQRFFQLEDRPDADTTRRLMRPFAPHRSLASYHLWATLWNNPWDEQSENTDALQ